MSVTPEYLYSNYALWTPPSELLRSVSDIVTPLLKPVYKVIAPLQAGSKRENELEYTSDIAEAKAEIYDEISSRPVVICELPVQIVVCCHHVAEPVSYVASLLISSLLFAGHGTKSIKTLMNSHHSAQKQWHY